MDVEKLKEQASSLAGRDVEILQLENGEYIAEWFSFQHAPPPPAPTAVEAYQEFIRYMKSLKESGNATEDDRA